MREEEKRGNVQANCQQSQQTNGTFNISTYLTEHRKSCKRFPLHHNNKHVFYVTSRGRRSRVYPWTEVSITVLTGGTVDQLEHQRSTGHDARATGEEVPFE